MTTVWILKAEDIEAIFKGPQIVITKTDMG